MEDFAHFGVIFFNYGLVKILRKWRNINEFWG